MLNVRLYVPSPLKFGDVSQLVLPGGAVEIRQADELQSSAVPLPEVVTFILALITALGATVTLAALLRVAEFTVMAAKISPEAIPSQISTIAARKPGKDPILYRVIKRPCQNGKHFFMPCPDHLLANTLSSRSTYPMLPTAAGLGHAPAAVGMLQAVDVMVENVTVVVSSTHESFAHDTVTVTPPGPVRFLLATQEAGDAFTAR